MGGKTVAARCANPDEYDNGPARARQLETVRTKSRFRRRAAVGGKPKVALAMRSLANGLSTMETGAKDYRRHNASAFDVVTKGIGNETALKALAGDKKPSKCRSCP